MKSNTYRIIYTDKNADYVFNSFAFKAELNKRKNGYREGQKITFQEIFEELAEQLNVSVEAVKRWKQGYNGPSDIDIVKQIASYLEIDYMVLLSDVNGGKDKMIESRIDNIQSTEAVDSIRTICGELMEVISLYGSTEGYGEFSISNGEEYFKRLSGMLYQIECHINHRIWYITKEQYEKLYCLLLEVRHFVENDTGASYRWVKIEPAFSIFSYSDDWRDEDLDSFLTCYLEGEEAEYIKNELEHYTNGHPLYDNVYEAVGYIVTNWFMRIVRHDFPECFQIGE